MTTVEIAKLKRGLDKIIVDLDKWGNLISADSFPYRAWKNALEELLDYKAAYGEVPKLVIR